MPKTPIVKMMTSQITKECLKRTNFEPEDFFASPTAKRLNINNQTNNVNILTNLMAVADKIQEIRDLLGHPIRINSAYRCPALNKAVGSKPTSQHPKGEAIDFVCPAFGTPAQVVEKIKQSKVVVDQCIEESTWTHLSIKLTGNRNRNQFAKLLNGKFTVIA